MFKCEPKSPEDCESCLPPKIGPPWLKNLTNQASLNIENYEKKRRKELKNIVENQLTAVFKNGKQINPILLISLNEGYLYRNVKT